MQTSPVPSSNACRRIIAPWVLRHRNTRFSCRRRHETTSSFNERQSCCSVRQITERSTNADSVGHEQLENYLYLATCYTGWNRRAPDAYASELSAVTGLIVRPASQSLRHILPGRRSSRATAFMKQPSALAAGSTSAPANRSHCATTSRNCVPQQAGLLSMASPARSA